MTTRQGENSIPIGESSSIRMVGLGQAPTPQRITVSTIAPLKNRIGKAVKGCLPCCTADPIREATSLEESLNITREDQATRSSTAETPIAIIPCLSGNEIGTSSVAIPLKQNFSEMREVVYNEQIDKLCKIIDQQAETLARAEILAATQAETLARTETLVANLFQVQQGLPGLDKICPCGPLCPCKKTNESSDVGKASPLAENLQPNSDFQSKAEKKFELDPPNAGLGAVAGFVLGSVAAGPSKYVGDYCEKVIFHPAGRAVETLFRSPAKKLFSKHQWAQEDVEKTHFAYKEALAKYNLSELSLTRANSCPTFINGTNLVYMVNENQPIDLPFTGSESHASEGE